VFEKTFLQHDSINTMTSVGAFARAVEKGSIVTSRLTSADPERWRMSRNGEALNRGVLDIGHLR
jgi:hypothetical protein